MVSDVPTAALPSEPTGARFIGKWNWGASFLYPYWLMTHRNVPMGIAWLVLGFIPLLNVIGLGAWIYYGRNGNRVAVSSGRYVGKTEAEFVTVQNIWRNWAFGVFAVELVILILYVMTAASHPVGQPSHG